MIDRFANVLRSFQTYDVRGCAVNHDIAVSTTIPKYARARNEFESPWVIKGVQQPRIKRGYTASLLHHPAISEHVRTAHGSPHISRHKPALAFTPTTHIYLQGSMSSMLP